MSIDESLLTAYVLGELSDKEKTEVENFLQSSPQARESLEEIRSSVGLMQNFFSEESPEHLGEERVEEIVSQPVVSPSPVIPLFGFVAPLVAVAAAALFYFVPFNTNEPTAETPQQVVVKKKNSTAYQTTLVGGGNRKGTVPVSGNATTSFHRTDSISQASIDWLKSDINEAGLKTAVFDELKKFEPKIIQCLKNYSSVQSFNLRVYPNKSFKALSVNGGFNSCIQRHALVGSELPSAANSYDVTLHFASTSKSTATQ